MCNIQTLYRKLHFQIDFGHYTQHKCSNIFANYSTSRVLRRSKFFVTVSAISKNYISKSISNITNLIAVIVSIKFQSTYHTAFRVSRVFSAIQILHHPRFDTRSLLVHHSSALSSSFSPRTLMSGRISRTLAPRWKLILMNQRRARANLRKREGKVSDLLDHKYL